MLMKVLSVLALTFALATSANCDSVQAPSQDGCHTFTRMASGIVASDMPWCGVPWLEADSHLFSAVRFCVR